MSVHKIPDLEFTYPDCTACPDGGNTSYDGDAWWCESCDAAWDANGTNGEAGDD